VQKRKTHRVDNNIAEINQVWIKPPAGMLKCNVDKACYADQNIELECVCMTIKDALLQLMRRDLKASLSLLRQMKHSKFSKAVFYFCLN
jgi:hypothetical protein